MLDTTGEYTCEVDVDSRTYRTSTVIPLQSLFPHYYYYALYFSIIDYNNIPHKQFQIQFL